MVVQKVSHLKADRGRYFYRRRVPQKHQKTLGEKVWKRPCGDVPYQKAVSLVTAWAEEHDALIRSLDDPQVAAKLRYRTEVKQAEPAMVKVADTITDIGMDLDGLRGGDIISAAKAGLKQADEHPEQSPAARLVAYRSILVMLFGDHVVLPSDPDDRDEFEMIKRKLERRVADLAVDPNTISAVAELYYNFASVRPGVRAKYRRNIKMLVTHFGDLSIQHVTARQLREFRDAQARTMQVASLHAVFTPIKGMFSYAIEEELIDINPMGSVRLQKEKRPIKEIK